ncbi:PH domain-containing protein [Amycolatopsis sp. NPDC024027]|uniref:PH domain-containing protein n=1 Tax=Amycolatopsis sp. NPDC024027 TaxID=3154327 RepID=UPI0033EC4681
MPERLGRTGTRSDTDETAVEPGTGDAGPAGAGAGWRRLSRRTLGVHLKWLVPPAASLGAYALWTGGDLEVASLYKLGMVSVAFVAVTVYEVVQLLTTHFRVTGEVFELRKGLVLRRHRSIRRGRVRRVDLTAGPAQQLFALVIVRIGTGSGPHGKDHEVKLSALSKRDALALQAELLAGAGAPAEDPARDPAVAEDGTIAALRWSWIRYAPLTMWGGLAIVGLVALATRVADWFGLSLDGVFRWLARFFQEASPVQVILSFGAVFAVLSALSSLLLFCEQWWRYRFEIEGRYTYRVRRGLLTTRQIAIDRRRVRGVEVTQPLPLRLFGAGRVEVIATGLGASDDDYTGMQVVTPAVPRGEADRIAAAIAEQSPSPTATTRLRPHPPAALRRRLLRGVAAALVPAAVLVVLGWSIAPAVLPSVGIVAAAGVLLGLLLGVDAYRALGHDVSGDYLVTRYGTLRRHTVALRRDGVIGWRISRSPGQRLSGLVTVSAVTAAGKGGAYQVRDVRLPDGVAFAGEAVPGLLAPFVVARQAPEPEPARR